MVEPNQLSVPIHPMSAWTGSKTKIMNPAPAFSVRCSLSSGHFKSLSYADDRGAHPPLPRQCPPPTGTCREISVSGHGAGGVALLQGLARGVVGVFLQTYTAPGWCFYRGGRCSANTGCSRSIGFMHPRTFSTSSS